MDIVKQQIQKIYININLVKSYKNHLMYVTDVNPEVAVEEKDILIMQEKLMTLIMK